MGKPAHRPTILTEELTADLCHYLELGNYIETAAALVGVNKRNIFAWLKVGRQHEKENHESIYVFFLRSIEKAQAIAENEDLSIIRDASLKNWTAAAWRLERRFPSRWGRQPQIEEDDELDYKRPEFLRK